MSRKPKTPTISGADYSSGLLLMTSMLKDTKDLSLGREQMPLPLKNHRQFINVSVTDIPIDDCSIQPLYFLKGPDFPFFQN